MKALSPSIIKKDGKRFFNIKDRNACWEGSPIVPNRDPDRWRLDGAGNPVMKELWGFTGLFGYELDHIKPWAEGEIPNPNFLYSQTSMKLYECNNFFCTHIMS